jgi:hypothetical protein
VKTVAERSLDLTSLFEAEILVRLMLWRWGHPLADDEEFAKGLLDDAAAALGDAVRGVQLIEGVPAGDLCFVAAVWYAEQCAVGEGGADPETSEGRAKWLEAVRRALPSCFCDPADLEK